MLLFGGAHSAMITKSIAAGMLVCAFTATAFPDLPPTMTKIVAFYVAPNLSEDSRAKPKTIYVSGNRYARTEEAGNNAGVEASVIIVDQPNVWVVDLKHQTGQHSVNHGPVQEVHEPICGANGPVEVADCEFGREAKFFDSALTDSVPAQQLSGRRCKGRKRVVGDYRLILYTDSVTNFPVELHALRKDAVMFKVHYISYEPDIAFDPSLFRVPKNIVCVEIGD